VYHHAKQRENGIRGKIHGENLKGFFSGVWHEERCSFSCPLLGILLQNFLFHPMPIKKKKKKQMKTHNVEFSAAARCDMASICL